MIRGSATGRLRIAGHTTGPGHQPRHARPAERVMARCWICQQWIRPGQRTAPALAGMAVIHSPCPEAN